MAGDALGMRSFFLALLAAIACLPPARADEPKEPAAKAEKKPEIIQLDLSELPPELAEKLRQLPARPDAAAANPGARIALLDVGQLFDKHLQFQAQMEVMKKEVKKFEDFLREEQGKLKQIEAAAVREEQGSAERLRLEKVLAESSETLKTQTQAKRQEFLRREADLYFRVYREVEVATGAYAKEHGITLVLRYSSTGIDPQDRDSVLRGINRPIVFRDRESDITTPILAALNKSTLAAAPEKNNLTRQE